MSGITDTREHDQRFGRAPTVASPRTEPVTQAGLRSRFSAWRAERRATRHERRAARSEWADGIPVWAFGILHRGG
ncbi:hypothetical protein J2X63_001198 [Agromyces sp. 3263]|nr:hypothetical protein [Agromyces sp. 3263]